MMVELLPVMLERAGILIILAFLLSRMKAFRHLIDRAEPNSIYEKGILTVLFGLFGVISNYTGVAIHHHVISESWHMGLGNDSAIANTRIMGVAMGGLLGGPVVGMGAGLIAGLHRFTIGGFTSTACGISTIFAGIFTGLLGQHFNLRKRYSPWRAVIIGVCMEMIQMGFILLIAKPYTEALELVKIIAVPMIMINGFGTFIFILIIQTILSEEEKTRTLQTHKALDIAQQTLPYFRQGLTTESCKRVADIMLKNTRADAVSITNRDYVLSHVGAASDHHIPMQQMATKLTQTALQKGSVLKASTRQEIGCSQQDCPLQAAIVLPLIAHRHIVGTLKLYFKDPGKLTVVEQELAEGLSRLFSVQLELAEAEQQRRLLKDAEIKALQAQVHPHFLFNAMNTISCLIRTDADEARNLLLKLSTFFRSNLQGARQMLIPLEKELQHVEAYLALEQARFPDKYTVRFTIEPSLKKSLIPPFTLQPLVENAVRHAFSKKDRTTKGSIHVEAYKKGEHIIIDTCDNGTGIPQELLNALGSKTVHSKEGTGTAIWNIKKRIQEIYGEQASFHITSRSGTGTKITIILPESQKGREEYVKSLYSG